MSTTPTASRERPSFSIPSIVAIVATLLIFFTEGYDVLLAIVAIVAGVIGGLLALAPGIRGGITSILSVILALLAIVVSLFQVVL
ncbi:hypothetical protein [Phycisphaera mikurensis]|uniref:Uncharacterized protein n=1 Tax=Phycisphaera mikurensis (strain NBRC 102666 / KCTC 22515 / FYK2301M01) TaxID=1142394 RepID=I0IBS9_PHYMF|nr:hypothetical protein [Phycisphaera mikurensis]MBB6442054.1 membrane protein implicated in regulation of membrane protease activity [Phycisphaera mikurensis]BAM02717.1 hypothetical protein PSMK_05580 [Phycisphaera mikurensis NBRC 102666]